MAVMVKALGYYSHKGGKGGIRKVKQHLKYLEFGKEHQNEPVGFNDREETVTRAEFMERIRAQPEHGVIAHKLVISLSQDERDRCGVSMRELVQETMAQWGLHLGRDLQWIAFEHDDPGHPHVHVVVAGYAGGRQVGLYERDLNALRGWAERDRERQSERTRERSARELRTIEQEIERMAKLDRRERDRGWDRGR
jgi:hypothetical protein